MFHPDMVAGGGTYYLGPMKDAAAAIGIELIPAQVRTPSEIEHVFTTFGSESGTGLVTLPDVFLFKHRDVILARVNQQRIPAVYFSGGFVRDGGLVFYGVEAIDTYPLAASYVDRILKGVKPADLPVQAPTRFRLLINLKAAQAIGLPIPPMLLARADEVIE